MIDIHCHVLPEIDDGANSVDVALQILDGAIKDGTEGIVFTPHFSVHTDIKNIKERIRPLYRDMRRIIDDINMPIKIYLGTEYLYISKEHFLDNKSEIETMNNTKYMLTEFYFDESDKFILNAIDNIIDNDLIPIIAHPERYDCIKWDIDVAREMKQHGAVLQLNKGSLFGVHGRQTKDVAFELLSRKKYSFIGSDAHNVNMRNAKLYQACQIIGENFGEKYARDLCCNNPYKMLEGQDIRKKVSNEENEEKIIL